MFALGGCGLQLCSLPDLAFLSHLILMGILLVHLSSNLYTAIHSYTQLYTSIHSCTQLYTSIHIYTQLYTAIHSYTQLYTAIHSYTQLYTAIHSYTQLYTACTATLSSPGWLPISNYMYRHSRLMDHSL